MRTIIHFRVLPEPGLQARREGHMQGHRRRGPQTVGMGRAENITSLLNFFGPDPNEGE